MRGVFLTCPIIALSRRPIYLHMVLSDFRLEKKTKQKELNRESCRRESRVLRGLAFGFRFFG